MSGREDAFLVSVVNLARTLGWIVSHHKQSVQLVRDRTGKVVGRRTNLVGDRGLPDLVLVHPVRARLIFAELKGDLGPRGGGDDVSLSEDQIRWCDALALVGESARGIVRYFLWRPVMIDAIAEELAR